MLIHDVDEEETKEASGTTKEAAMMVMRWEATMTHYIKKLTTFRLRERSWMMLARFMMMMAS